MFVYRSWILQPLQSSLTTTVFQRAPEDFPCHVWRRDCRWSFTSRPDLACGSPFPCLVALARNSGSLIGSVLFLTSGESIQFVTPVCDVSCGQLKQGHFPPGPLGTCSGKPAHMNTFAALCVPTLRGLYLLVTSPRLSRTCLPSPLLLWVGVASRVVSTLAERPVTATRIGRGVLPAALDVARSPPCRTGLLPVTLFLSLLGPWCSGRLSYSQLDHSDVRSWSVGPQSFETT